MRRRCLIIFVTLLAVLGTLPRLHCLCHHHEVLLITAATVDCCHMEHGQSTSAFCNGELSCFKTADSEALGGSTWKLPVSFTAHPAGLTAFLSHPQVSHPIILAARHTRAPPFFRQYELGLYLLHGVLQS